MKIPTTVTKDLSAASCRLLLVSAADLEYKATKTKASTEMTTFWNNSSFLVSADTSNFEARRLGVTAVDPQDGPYDYRLELRCNLTSVLRPLTLLAVDPPPCEAPGDVLPVIFTSGAREAWRSLHSLLSDGRSAVTDDKTRDVLTAFHERVSNQDSTWETFWLGLLSESFDSRDLQGNSVRVIAVQDALRVGELNDDGKNSSLIGDIARSLSADATPTSQACGALSYFGTLATFMTDVGRLQASDTERGRLRFEGGDALALRLHVRNKSIGFGHLTGLIRIEHQED